MKDFKDIHELHAIAIGGIVYYFTKSIKSSAVVGASVYAYMNYFGHGQPKKLS